MIVIIDYGLGNLSSVLNALNEIGEEAFISNRIEDIERADKIILPGVGAFNDGMKNLINLGLDKCLYEQVIIKKKKFLGICLGMQLIAEEGFENQNTKGLGWIKGSVKKLEVNGLKLPHIGWNNIQFTNSKLFKEIEQDTDVYFVHSFHFICNDKENIAATCSYGDTFTAAIQKGNIYATQFHPEKSHKHGLKILKNFIED
tara:strand:+ start:1163 stop:1765 length:603 start_codon:yes stop_codon:yes gene_type:complete